MSEFRLLGNLYVSEWNGSSANPGSAISPYSHPADAPSSSTNIIIVGTGYYFGGWTGVRRISGDGKVVLDLNGASTSPVTGVNTSETSPAIRGVTIRKASLFFPYSGTSGSIGHVMDCFLEMDSYQTFARSSNPYIRCILKTYLASRIAGITAGTTAPASHYNCIFLSNFDQTWGWVSGFSIIQNCYVPKGVNILITNTSNFNNTFLNNLFNGTLTVGGLTYELKRLIDGSTRPDANPIFLDMISIAPNCYSNGNFASLNLNIVDIENRICGPDSDLLRRSNVYGFIGGFVPGFEVKKGDSGPNIEINTLQIDNSNPDSWVINSPTHNEGFIDLIVKIADTIVQVPRIHFDSLFAFRGNQPGGSVQNNNVPDFFPATYSPLSQPGLKPNRLSYKLRTSRSAIKPSIEADWDNDSATLGTTPAAFYDQEASIQPTINVVGGVRYGNANPAGFGGSSNTINARWVHVRVRLTNLRTI